MKTKQIVFTAPNTAQLLESEYLPPKAQEVTVSLAFSAISSGTEKANLTGAHTMARPKQESSPGFWTDQDDICTVLKLIQGKRLNLKDMICQIHSPEEAPEVYSKLISDPNFPIGVLFDWTGLE